MFLLSLFCEPAKFAWVPRQFIFPGRLVLEGFNNLRCDCVLLFARKHRYLAQSIFQQFGHGASVAEQLGTGKGKAKIGSYVPERTGELKKRNADQNSQ
jgi:hypothetical protein